MQLLAIWVLTAVSLIITAYIVPGIEVDGVEGAAIGAIVLGLVNAIIRPILLVLTFPITILTLGLFLLVINALVLKLVAMLTPKFRVTGFISALVGSIILSIITSILNQILY